MSAEPRNDSGAITGSDDEHAEKDDVVSNRDKMQRRPEPGMDGNGVQSDEDRDTPANSRPLIDEPSQSQGDEPGEEPAEPSPNTDKAEMTGAAQQIDRPGFDLGGSTGETDAGNGLGFGTDAKQNRQDWRLPR